MTEPISFWAEVGRSVLASGVVTAVGMGALGGATSALAVGGATRRALLRQIVLGAMLSGGTGSLAMAVIAKTLSLPAELIPAAGAGSSASYFIGVFGPAVIEVLLTRIRAGRLPGEGGGVGGNS